MKGGPLLAAGDQPPTIVVGPALRVDEFALLCERLSALLDERRADLVACDVGAVERLDLGTVDLLARLELAARRRGCELRIEHASPELVDLLGFVGLRGALRVEPERKPEQREEARGIEEERDARDATA